jgi:hypothetical protein
MAFTAFSQYLQHKHTASTDTLTANTDTLMASVGHLTYMSSATLSQPLFKMFRVSTSTLLSLRQSQGLYWSCQTPTTSILASTFYKHCHHSMYYSHPTSTSTSSQLLHTDSYTFYSNDSYWHYHSLLLHS